MRARSELGLGLKWFDGQGTEVEGDEGTASLVVGWAGLWRGGGRVGVGRRFRGMSLFSLGWIVSFHLF